MSRAILVIDTNVVVAGLLTKDLASPVARVLDGMLAAAFPFVVSQALLGEYRTVLLRPVLRKLHGLAVGEVEALLTDLAQHAIVLEPSSSGAVAPRAPDPGDQFLWDLLAMRADLVLVSGDRRLLAHPAMRGRVRSPREVVDGG